MDLLSSLLPMDTMLGLAALHEGTLLVPLVLTAMTIMFVSFSVPGTLTPLSFLSGMLMGVGGILVIAIGALVGSHLLFLASRHFLRERMERRFGQRLSGVQEHLARKGPVYVAGARLAGVPGLLVTAGCAAAPISARSFGGASLLGMMPAIVLATSAGSAL